MSTSTLATDAPAARRVRPEVSGWVLATSVYLLAVFHRSSLGVAGLLAERRFGITSGQLGIFVLLQIGVYAAMQVPTGVLVDRYGPRRLLVCAAALMGAAQLLFALAPGYPTALLARALLGCGDAMTFISVLRFTSLRFSPRRYPVLVSFTATAGMVGNLLATLPLTLLLGAVGWTWSFAGAALASVVTAVAIWALLDDPTIAPQRFRTVAHVRRSATSVVGRLRAAWALPGTRLGFWVHFSSMCMSLAFGVLWGQPYLVGALGMSSSAASIVLLVGVLVSGCCGPVLGALIGRRPGVRVGIVLGFCTLTLLAWLVVLGIGDHPPAALVVPLFVATLVGGPVSMVAFALARDYNHAHIIGTASGVVNVGGFLAGALVSVGFGWTLTALGGDSAHALRLALVVPLAVQALGTLRVFVWLRHLRALIAGRQRGGADVPVPVARRYFWDRRWEPAHRHESVGS